MIKQFILIVLFGFYFLNIHTLSAQNAYSLKIIITHLKSNNGKVLLKLLDENDNALTGKILKITENKSVLTIPNLAKGYYSIKYFHDENDNDKMDTNWLGIPIEDYGFSNNATSMFGIPNIKNRLFYLDKNKTITLKIN